MGLELTILRDQAGRSNHWATGDYGEQGWNVGLWREPGASPPVGTASRGDTIK